MRIALIIPGGGTLWLAGKPGVSEREFTSVSDFRIAPAFSVQKDEFIRAANARVTDRKNLLLTCTFGTARLFASAAEAQVFACDYYLGQQRGGTLLLDIPRAGGSSIYRYMAGAVVHPPAIVAAGASLILTYTVEGPPFRNA